MPFITVKVPAGVLGDTAKAALTSGICAAAAECEQVPDDPKMRALCVVTIEEIGAGNRTYGGRDLSQMLVSVDAAVNIPKGILDDRSRARFVELLHQAVVDALPGEQRRITSSFIINEIENGTWGVNGSLWKLPDFCRRVRLPAPAASCRKSLTPTSGRASGVAGSLGPGELALFITGEHFACPIDP